MNSMCSFYFNIISVSKEKIQLYFLIALDNHSIFIGLTIKRLFRLAEALLIYVASLTTFLQSVMFFHFITCMYIYMCLLVEHFLLDIQFKEIEKSWQIQIFLKPTRGLLLGQIYLKLYTPSQINAFKLDMCNDNVRVIADPCGKIIV